MQKTLFIKLSIIAGLCFIFAIGLTMLTSLVGDRQRNADSVLRQIAKQHVYPQQIITPFIVVPSTTTTNCTSQSLKDNTCTPVSTSHEPILASQTQNNQTFNVSDDTYKRGIYKAISYNGEVSFDQTFALESQDINTTRLGSGPSQQSNLSKVDIIDSQLPSYVTNNKTRLEPLPTNEPITIKHWHKALLIIPVSDLRGVKALPTVTINGETFQASYPDTSIVSGLSYIEVAIPSKLMQKPSLDIKTNLPLSGISHIKTVPTGQNFKLTMHSNWNTPNFFGQALPDPKEFTNEGFSATWQNQYLSLANNQNLRQCLQASNHDCSINTRMGLNASTSTNNSTYRNSYDTDVEIVEAIDGNQSLSNIRLNGFATSFAKPNDIYRQTERTMKYALLLILVTFGTFFLFEVIKSTRIHPIQYLLVGSALLIFYVLLLPLTEQIVFWQAYLIAAVACVGLIGWYTYYVLGSVKRATIFTLLLGVLYAGFYGILTSEEMNLLLGAVFCFILLASVMYLTRKIDWYNVV